MRIVYLNPCGKLGGAETSLREILASVRASQPEWELWLVLGEDGPLARIARDLGVQVIIRPFPAGLGRFGDSGLSLAAVWPLVSAVPATTRYARNLAGLLRELRPDLIHTNGFKMHLLGAWARPRQVPLVWHIHDYVSSRPLASRFLRLSARACTVAIANSESVARDLRRLLPGLRVTAIHNAIDIERFSPVGRKLDLDALSGLTPADAGTIRAGLVATFARWKGHEVFLEALARLSGAVPVRGYIIGGPIYQTRGSQWSVAELQRRADEVCGPGMVGFTGFVEDSPAVMRALDIVVHASTEPEPFGMVIIEGMACGKAVIAARGGGASEIVIEGVNALAHPAGDSAALAGEIQRLASDASLRRRLGQAARQMAERMYTGERLAKELVALYQKAVGAPANDIEPATYSSLGAAGS